MKLSKADQKLVDRILASYRASEPVREMEQYISHGSVTTLRHCEHVVVASYLLNKRLHLHADLRTLLVSALLHDLYLYDWHTPDPSHKWHGYHHADKAEANAERYYHLTEKTLAAIHTHMWPLNLSRLPKSREAWILCLSDKYCAFLETVLHTAD